MEHGTLNLTRKPSQPILFQYTDENGQPQTITLTVNSIRGQQAKLAIKAPKAVTILREELL
jgi:carbon storage regulator CsrA